MCISINNMPVIPFKYEMKLVQFEMLLLLQFSSISMTFIYRNNSFHPCSSFINNITSVDNCTLICKIIYNYFSTYGFCCVILCIHFVFWWDYGYLKPVELRYRQTSRLLNRNIIQFWFSEKFFFSSIYPDLLWIGNYSKYSILK